MARTGDQLLLPTEMPRHRKGANPKRPAQFDWHLGSDPPSIQSHTDAKLRLLAEYLDRYFDVVCARAKEMLRISLVDAFSGGGLFQIGDDLRYGSPLVMIDAVRRARERVNRNRRNELKIVARYFFVDASADAIEYLRSSLKTHPIAHDHFDNIHIQQATASEVLPGIIENIKNWSSSGRSIFFLDQCGYKHVDHQNVRLIYNSLPKSEVIASYNFGALYDYMNNSDSFLTAVSSLGVNADHVKTILKERDVQATRFFAVNYLGHIFQEAIGAQYMSRFFLRSEAAGRDMWFVHYSKVPRSRWVMNDAHWAIGNASITQGDAGLDMVGFRPDWENQIGVDFGFSYTDEGLMHKALRDEFPNWLAQLRDSTGTNFGHLLTLSANSTAATEQQVKKALQFLETEGEIDVLTPSGRRKRPSALLMPNHQIMIPNQYRLYFQIP